MKILLLENDKHLRDTYKNFLEMFLKIDSGLDLTVDAPHSLKEALDLFLKTKHRIVIINEEMISNKEFIGIIDYHELKDEEKPQIISLTDKNIDMIPKNGIKLLQKPINTKNLKDAIEGTCEEVSKGVKFLIKNGGRKWSLKRRKDLQNMEC